MNKQGYRRQKKKINKLNELLILNIKIYIGDQIACGVSSLTSLILPVARRAFLVFHIFLTSRISVREYYSAASYTSFFSIISGYTKGRVKKRKVYEDLLG